MKDNETKEVIHQSDLLNNAMELCLEWGENWLSPIDKRLKEPFPQIDEGYAKKLDIFIRQAREKYFQDCRTALS